FREQGRLQINLTITTQDFEGGTGDLILDLEQTKWDLEIRFDRERRFGANDLNVSYNPIEWANGIYSMVLLVRPDDVEAANLWVKQSLKRRGEGQGPFYFTLERPLKIKLRIAADTPTDWDSIPVPVDDVIVASEQIEAIR
ncbi:MAG: hypothetical protein AAF570_18520, partial [Bacteroidota bacterium]